MAHIHTEPGQYDLTVSAYIVHTGVEPRLLLHRHKVLGVLMQPGGHVELTETPWQAITHEILEETGYDMGQLEVFQPRIGLPFSAEYGWHPHPVAVRSFRFGDLDHFHTDLVYAFLTSESPKHPVAEGESPSLTWITESELSALPPEETYEDVRQLGLYVLTTLINEWVPVPTD